MGRFAQAKRRGGGRVSTTQPAFEFSPPTEEDWGPEAIGSSLQATGNATCIAPALVYRWRAHGTFPWDGPQVGPCDELQLLLASIPAFSHWDVQAAWHDGGVQVSDWSATQEAI